MMGEIISKENIDNKTFRTTFYSTKIDKKVNSKQLHTKPAGKYAVKYWFI